MSKNLSQQVVLDRRGFVAATFATVAGLGLAGCSDTSAEADKGSTAGSPKSSEDTEASTTLDAKAFDKLVDNGPKADDDAIAASTWATAVKDAGVFKIGGVQTSTRFSPSSTRKTARPAASTPVSHSSCPTTSWARTRSRSPR